MIKECQKLKQEQKEKASNNKGKAKANVVQDHSDMDDMVMDFSVVVLEISLVENPRQWWVDTGSTRHICSDRSEFSFMPQSRAKRCTWAMTPPLKCRGLEKLS
jgi:hypothetical protein